MSAPAVDSNRYDEIPYPVESFAQSHPDRLASVATLFGMRPAPIDRCRVLELGCATGGNLIPMAERLPESSFVGIDISDAQIQAGLRGLEQLRLKNIELKNLSILDVDESLGQFDYIISHGVFSWIPTNVQHKLLEICNTRLAPHGVAYVSYNVYPGWHLRNLVREIACSAAAAGDPPKKRLAVAHKALRACSAALADEQTAYAKLLKAEIDVAVKQDRGYFFHEYLEADNHPIYFHEFANLAARHGLRYLGDATVHTMFASNYGPAISRNLAKISNDVISMEQHMDVLRNRGFRQTLLCHQEMTLTSAIKPAVLEHLYFASRIRAASPAPDLVSDAVERFVVERPDRVPGAAGSISSPFPPVKAALAHLGGIWPRCISFDDLVQASIARLAAIGGPDFISAEDRENLGHNLIQSIASGLIDIFSHPDSFVASVSQFPLASRLARVQSQYTGPVTNGRHEPTALTDVCRRLLPFLDGQHDRNSLAAILVSAVDKGDLSILINGIPASRGADVRPILEKTLDESLAELASRALLIA